MKNLFVRFVREEAGQDLIEYAMLATLSPSWAVRLRQRSAPTWRLYTAMGTPSDHLVGPGGQLGISMWDSRVSLSSRVCPSRSSTLLIQHS